MLNISLHPTEISRIRNVHQIKNYLKETKFELIDYYYGIKDFYSHRVIVAKKIDSKIF